MIRVGDEFGCLTVIEVLEAAAARERGLLGSLGRPVHRKATGAHVLVRCDCLLEFVVRARAMPYRARCGPKCELGKVAPAGADISEHAGRTTCRNPLCERKLRACNTTGFCWKCQRVNRRWYLLELIERRKAAGKCGWCARPGKTPCETCSAQARARYEKMKADPGYRARTTGIQQRRRLRLRAAGRCVCCGSYKLVTKVACGPCAENGRRHSREHARRKAAQRRAERMGVAA